MIQKELLQFLERMYFLVLREFLPFILLLSEGNDRGIPTDLCEEAAKIISTLPKFTSVMRNTFYLAVALSPLVLLLLKKIDAQNIRKDYLIAVSRNYCGEKHY
jgi:hypothetical protein